MVHAGMNAVDRSRAALDPRWGQAGISETSLMIIAGGHTGSLLALAAAGMGFRQIVLVGSSPDAGDHRISYLENCISSRYPDVLFSAFLDIPDPRLVTALFEKPDIMVADIDHLPPDSMVPDRYVLLKATADAVSVSVGSAPDQIPGEPVQKAETSLLAAGLALSEVRRLAAPCGQDTELRLPVTFIMPPAEGRPRYVKIAGAGGTGNWFAFAAGWMASYVHIWDGDNVEQSNRARCPWLSQPGWNKAFDLAANLYDWCSARMVPYDTDAGYTWLSRNRERTVAAFCTDTLASRETLNRSACDFGVPAVNLGTSLFGAAVYAITPRTACLRCRFPDLDERIKREKAGGETNRCGERLEPSAAVSNMIAAGAAAMIARRLHDPGFSFPGVLQYDAFAPERLWTDSIRPACSCMKKGIVTGDYVSF